MFCLNFLFKFEIIKLQNVWHRYRTVRDWFLNSQEAGPFYVDDRLFHLKMAERNEAIMFSAPPLSPGDYSPLPASAGVDLMERVCASVNCGFADTLLANASFLEQRFLQLSRDSQSKANPDPALASSALSLLQRLDSLAGRLEQKQDDRRVAILLGCLSQARAVFTPAEQASCCFYVSICY
jgi:hypothetical protein